MSTLQHELEGSAAESLAASLDRTGNLVTSVVPPGYERYVRILNPVEFGDGSVVPWSDIVEQNGLEPSPWMQWDELKAHLGTALSPDNAEPAMGDPHPSLAKALIRALRADEDRYYFASWIGYAETNSEATIEFSPSRREMVLYSGILVDESGSVLVPVTDAGRVPLYWWPKNLRWSVGQDLYARSLIVGCDLATAGRILAAPDLDAYVIRESDMVAAEDF